MRLVDRGVDRLSDHGGRPLLAAVQTLILHAHHGTDRE
jgi:hypothetical protein